MIQQARNAAMVMAEWGLPATHPRLDHDSKFASGFDAVLEADGTTVKRVGPRAPNLNAYAERWVRSPRRGCLIRLVIFGEKRLRHIVKEWGSHYLLERPRRAKGNAPLPKADPDRPRTFRFPTGEVRWRERLGGFLRHYSRDAAGVRAIRFCLSFATRVVLAACAALISSPLSSRLRI